ncbi:hypothetical protein NX059_007661, partial [Plenodomus lindquistii]
MSSSEDGAQLMAAFKKKPGRKPSAAPRPTSTPRRAVSDASTPVAIAFTPVNRPPKPRKLHHVRASPVRNRDEYEYFAPRDEVEEIVNEYSKRGDMMYKVRLWGDTVKHITFEELLGLPGGPEALQRFQPQSDPDETSSDADHDDMKLRRGNAR